MTRLPLPLASTALLALLAACGGGDKKTEQTTEATAPADPTNESADNGPVAEPAAPAGPTTSTAAPGPGAGTPAVPAAAGGVTLASFTGDAAKGEKVFGQCRTCHVTTPGVNKVGPTLHGVVGRKAGSIPGFRYSPANKNSGITWTEEQLFTYLEAPQRVVKGTYMAFGGLKNPQDRADVIAYLKTQG